jgi:hypothetical protein
MLKLNGWGLRPWMEFEIDPSSGRYTKRRLKSQPSWKPGYSGWGQELKVAGLGTVLCSVFLHQGEIILRLGSFSWNLFEPGLVVTHQDGGLHCEFSLHESSGKQVTFRYRRKDILLLIIDSTYDHLDMELANLPGMLPGWSEGKKADLVAVLEKHRTAGPGRPETTS